MPRKLLLLLRAYKGGTDNAFIFTGFNGRLGKSSPEKTPPGEECITYARFSTCFALSFGEVMGFFLRSSYPSMAPSPDVAEKLRQLLMHVSPLSFGGSTAIGSPRQRSVAT